MLVVVSTIGKVVSDITNRRRLPPGPGTGHREEIDELLEMHDWRSWASLGIDWGLVFGAMALVAWLPHVLTVLLALFLIGARQLGLAVLMQIGRAHV